jgi:hypothetical protein
VGAELEILRLPTLPDQKGVRLERRFRPSAAGDRAVLDRPKGGISLPTREGGTIEEGNVTGGSRIGGAQGDREQGEKYEETHRSKGGEHGRHRETKRKG